MSASTQEVTQWLVAWSGGDEAALEKLVPLIYNELHRLAQRYMGRERAHGRRGQTLQTTGLVNEAYLRLVDASGVRWKNRAHFYAIAANLMRRILVDAARSRGFAKRGAGAWHVTLADAALGSGGTPQDLVALDDALNQLAKTDSRKAQVVELRFFGGLSVEETAKVLDVSPGTILRDWRMAKAWLLRELSG
jgi:RNA polymerase sigma factor (TIGR02999 family)